MTDKLEAFDVAMKARLARLSTLPVDTTSLEAAIRAEAGAPESAAPAARPSRWRPNFRPVAAVAASLLLMAALALVLLQGGPVQASSADMFRMHQEIVAGKVPIAPADSIDEVNTLIAAFAKGQPILNTPPEAVVRGCCMRDVGNKKAACVLFNNGDGKVTLTVADLMAVKPLKGNLIEHKGRRYQVDHFEGLNMVMTDRGTHRICLIGDQSHDALMTLCENVKF